MKIINNKIKNLFLIKHEKFRDKRGYFQELLKEKKISKKFPFIVMSYSRKNVIRGLHLQTKKSQGKFVSVIKGKIFDVAIDLRKNSKTFGEVFTFELSEKNSYSIFVPPGFAHGFQCLDKENYIVYGCTNYRSKKNEIGIMYNDKDIGIDWPVKKPILSSKDKSNMTFKEYQNT